MKTGVWCLATTGVEVSQTTVSTFSGEMGKSDKGSGEETAWVRARTGIEGAQCEERQIDAPSLYKRSLPIKGDGHDEMTKNE